MELKQILGANIVIKRKQKSITQQMLASMSDISISHLRNIEHGVGNTTVDVLERISRSLGIKPSHLLIPDRGYKKRKSQ